MLEQNLASQNTYNLNIGAPLAITKWWNTSNDATLYYTDFKSPNLMGLPFSSGKLSYLLNTTQTFSVSSSINAELTMDYQSAQVYGTYAVKPLYGIDFGVSKSFANKKATVKLAANDLFNLRKANISSALPLQDYRLYQKEESRIFRLSFSYNFGSSSIKAVRERSKSSDSEQSRVRSKN
ncbi:outer membrane beta-barrel protein [Pedobacter sp. UC225_65]|uniref:outer membrane beta-barrel protein n=1 Tax=Pedobacter sp. UC225_65 TaxID=3350173 RepID=UPI00366AD807